MTLNAAQLETIREVLEIAIQDDNFIDTTSGGGASPAEVVKLRAQMQSAYDAVLAEMTTQDMMIDSADYDALANLIAETGVINVESNGSVITGTIPEGSDYAGAAVKITSDGDKLTLEFSEPHFVLDRYEGITQAQIIRQIIAVL